MTTTPASEILVSHDPTTTERFRDHATAALVTSAIGDSMGWITEFMRSKDALHRYTGMQWLNRYVSWPKRTGGRFNAYVDQINEGDYSDDTQLALCVARSIEHDGRGNARYFMKVELPLWMQYARGAGSTINAAAKAASRKKADWNSNFFRYRQGTRDVDYRDAGANGAAMRVLPLAIANVADRRQLHDQVWTNAIITHGHPRAIVGACLIAEAARLVLAGENLDRQEFFPGLLAAVDDIEIPDGEMFEAWVKSWNAGTERFQVSLDHTKDEARDALGLAAQSRHRPVDEIIQLLGCYERDTKGSGIATTAAALALFYRYGGSVRGCIEHAVNLIGTDTDTIAAMAGGLTGALVGTGEIPEAWAVKVQDFTYLNRVAESLARIGLREGTGWDLGPQTVLSGPVPDATELSRATSFSNGQRVSHPIFGMGWISQVQTQEIRRRKGGTITLVDVEFDTGQRIRLRTRPELLRVDQEQVEEARSRMRSDGNQLALRDMA